GLLAPKPLGVFRYRLLRSVPDNRLHFYLELAMSLGNTKVYGSMNDERSAETETDRIVSDLLGKRKGMLVAASRSSLENVAIGADGVIDGFEITGKPTVNAGVLST
ncbi:MAG: hypothetical protein KIC78_08775, partial [Prevotella sp.]|uniref:hypothetical protein n=1 Tax=Prevotella sp. TaxID=59823 RepID=UPI00258059BE